VETDQENTETVTEDVEQPTLRLVHVLPSVPENRKYAAFKNSDGTMFLETVSCLGYFEEYVLRSPKDFVWSGWKGVRGIVYGDFEIPLENDEFFVSYFDTQQNFEIFCRANNIVMAEGGLI